MVSPTDPDQWLVVQLHRSVPYTLLGLESEVRFDLTEEQKLLEQTVREFANAEVKPVSRRNVVHLQNE